MGTVVDGRGGTISMPEAMRYAVNEVSEVLKVASVAVNIFPGSLVPLLNFGTSYHCVRLASIHRAPPPLTDLYAQGMLEGRNEH